MEMATREVFPWEAVLWAITLESSSKAFRVFQKAHNLFLKGPLGDL